MNTSIPSKSLAAGFGIEIEKRSLMSLLRHAPRLQQLLAQHRLLLVRGVSSDPYCQLRVSHLLGRLVANPWHGLVLGKRLPEMRIESTKLDPATQQRPADPYSRHWHSDLSWATKPADYTVLFALEAEHAAAPTCLADTQAGYAGLPDAYKKKIEPWVALHDVAASRSLRRDAESHGVGRSQQDSNYHNWQRYGQLGRLWLAWRHRAGVPQAGGPDGSAHRVVQRDAATGKAYVYLGDHAWGLEGFERVSGLAEIDELNERVTNHKHVYRHSWAAQDLLIIDNRSLLHRRGADQSRSGSRVLRRTLVWAR